MNKFLFEFNNDLSFLFFFEKNNKFYTNFV